MKILFLTSRLPYPPDQGDRLRAFNILQVLSADHEIDLVTFVDGPVKVDSRKTLEKVCNRVETVALSKNKSYTHAAQGILSSDPLQVWYYRDNQMENLIEEMSSAGGYDVVYSHLFRVFPYAQLVKGAYNLVDFTDVVSRETLQAVPYRQWFLRSVYRMEATRIRRYEKWIAEKADECWVISQAEKDILEAVGAGGNIQVVPNGVDERLFQSVDKMRVPGRINFLGHLEVFHNTDAVRFYCDDILPKVRDELGDVVDFVIAGAGDLKAVQDLATRDGVSLRGFVKNIAEFHAEASVFVAPLRFAAGTQNKVLQAMAVGTPCIVSPDVQRGLGAKVGKEVIVASTPDEWARETVRILNDDTLAHKIGEAGRAYVKSRFSWDVVRSRMNAIEKSLAEESSNS